MGAQVEEQEGVEGERVGDVVDDGDPQVAVCVGGGVQRVRGDVVDDGDPQVAVCVWGGGRGGGVQRMR